MEYKDHKQAVKFPKQYIQELKNWVKPKVGDTVMAWGAKRKVTAIDGGRIMFDGASWPGQGMYEGCNWRFIKVL